MKPNAPRLPLERRTLGWVLFATFLIKSWLAMAIPITSDEAYFVQWATHLDFGYYDHPPMAGWLIHGTMLLGHGLFWVRLGAILATLAIGAGIYWLLREYGEERALGAALLFLLSPIHLLTVLVTTDTPLIFFSFFSAACLFRALKTDRMGWYALSGLCLGAAFLSKYFAVLLGFGYFLYWLTQPKTWRRTGGFLLVFALVLPFAGVNLAWNYWHGWPNILFNLMNRNKGETFAIGKLAGFLVGQLYLVTPFLAWKLWKGRAKLQILAVDRRFALFAYAFLAPLAVFALLSLKKNIGLHWVLSFYPCFFVLLALVFNKDHLRSSLKAMAWFSGAHLLLVAVILALPISLFHSHRRYAALVMGFHPEEVVAGLRPLQDRYTLASTSYAEATILEYALRQHVVVFGKGSFHARQDDLLTDWRALDGKSLLLFGDEAPRLEAFEPYFGRMEILTFQVRGATFHCLLGQGFRYDVYREKVLRPIKEDYYAIPKGLPTGGAYFQERYFGEEWTRSR